jgi:hypothetical protein
LLSRKSLSWMSRTYKEEVTDEDFKDTVEADDDMHTNKIYVMDTLEDTGEDHKETIEYDSRDPKIHPDWCSYPKGDPRRY